MNDEQRESENRERGQEIPPAQNKIQVVSQHDSHGVVSGVKVLSERVPLSFPRLDLSRRKGIPKSQILGLYRSA